MIMFSRCLRLLWTEELQDEEVLEEQVEEGGVACANAKASANNQWDL